ncbi:MAG: Prephenate dehydratase [uncultured Pseudonocardia sp.]|uniref:Prephenate dehydratase n=1 Tax=uncultured Pseudonocardia sp. TaxID=211455 RepID=A0A6J4PMZ7_9PSEU|nr:MAG: Prephenate dehydratase [uncultured Pseudonocardia sp.]
MTARLAFLGPHATFTEQALRSLPESRGAELLPCTGSTAVLDAVRRGEADAGCVPIENSVEGAVGAVLDGLVADPPLVIAREALVAVRFVVVVRPGTRAAAVRRLGSHPHAVAQTRGWIAAHLPDAEVLLTSSTSDAAAQVAAGDLDAAVAAPLAAEQHGLEVLVDDVADTPGAVTRFVLVTPPGPPPAPTASDRTTIAATTENRPGSLLALLAELSVRGIDLTRIESRPIKDRPGEYWFHLDVTGHVADPALGEALAALHRRCDRVRFLGSFPRATDRPGSAPGTAPLDHPALRDSGAAAFTASQHWLAGLRAGTAS